MGCYVLFKTNDIKCPICGRLNMFCNCIENFKTDEIQNKRKVILDHLYLLSENELKNVIKLDKKLNISYKEDYLSSIQHELKLYTKDERLELCPICECNIHDCQCCTDMFFDTSRISRYHVILDQLHLLEKEQINHIISIQKNLEIDYSDPILCKIYEERKDNKK